jgi:protein subunit release factor A
MKDSDLDIKYTKGSGPGGQHKNKTETCVVITHIPTGIRERCQDTRYQKRNLKIAKDRLRKKIKQIELNKINDLKNKSRKERLEKGIIRTYNYTRNEVHDHRTKIKANLKRVMNGEIDLLF